MSLPFPARRRAAFTLVELMVVILIIGIIAYFLVPAAVSILRGTALNQAQQTLGNQFRLARQLATSRNRMVEIRLYQYADPEQPGEIATQPATGQFRALQLFEIFENGQALPIDQPQRLPASVVMDSTTNFSTIIGGSTTSPITPKTPSTKDPVLPRGIGTNYKYVAMRFLQDGSTNLPINYNNVNTPNLWFISIRNLIDRPTGNTMTDSTGRPLNYFTLQIDPISGAIRGYRPTAG